MEMLCAGELLNLMDEVTSIGGLYNGATTIDKKLPLCVNNDGMKNASKKFIIVCNDILAPVSRSQDVILTIGYYMTHYWPYTTLIFIYDNDVDPAFWDLLQGTLFALDIESCIFLNTREDKRVVEYLKNADLAISFSDYSSIGSMTSAHLNSVQYCSQDVFTLFNTSTSNRENVIFINDLDIAQTARVIEAVRLYENKYAK